MRIILIQRIICVQNKIIKALGLRIPILDRTIIDYKEKKLLISSSQEIRCQNSKNLNKNASTSIHRITQNNTNKKRPKYNKTKERKSFLMIQIQMLKMMKTNNMKKIIMSSILTKITVNIYSNNNNNNNNRLIIMKKRQNQTQLRNFSIKKTQRNNRFLKSNQHLSHQFLQESLKKWNEQ